MSKIAFDFEDRSAAAEYKYEQTRYLDSLAYIFYLQSKCAAALENKGTFYISFNSSATKLPQNRAKVLIKTLSEKNETDILFLTLILNKEFTTKAVPDLCAILQDNTEFTSLKEIAEGFREDIENSEDFIDKNFKKIINNELSLRSGDLVAKYIDLLDKISRIPLELNLKSKFLRPYQDVKKLYKYLTDSNKELNIELLPNDANIHAEYNISQKFPLAELLEINYIGVSKLCCGYCHAYLNKMGFKHRGTHGTCDDAWNMAYPYQIDDFKESIKPIMEFAPRNQERLLSTDEEFERGIDEGEFFAIKSQFIRAAGGGRGGGGAAAPEEPAFIISSPPEVVFPGDSGAASGGGAVLGDSSS